MWDEHIDFHRFVRSWSSQPPPPIPLRRLWAMMHFTGPAFTCTIHVQTIYMWGKSVVIWSLHVNSLMKIIIVYSLNGHCSHIVGLLKSLQGFKLHNFTSVPEHQSCTSIPQQWHVPRGAKIKPVPINHVVVARPTEIRKRKPVTCQIDISQEYVKGRTIPLIYFDFQNATHTFTFSLE